MLPSYSIHVGQGHLPAPSSIDVVCERQQRYQLLTDVWPIVIDEGQEREDDHLRDLIEGNDFPLPLVLRPSECGVDAALHLETAVVGHTHQDGRLIQQGG
jgi:hypothetical protein